MSDNKGAVINRSKNLKHLRLDSVGSMEASDQSDIGTPLDTLPPKTDFATMMRR